jgi:hypothetical protein
MKRYIALLSIVCAINTVVIAQPSNVVQRLHQFKTTKGRQKAQWLDFAKSYHDKKYNLLKKHELEWIAFGQKNITDWNNLTDCSREAKDALFAKELNKAVALHRKHLSEWKKLAESHKMEGQSLHNQHEQELEMFVIEEE